MSRFFWVIGFYLLPGCLFAQKPLDACFASVSPLGTYSNSDSIVNLCGACSSNFSGSNVIEWDGTKWVGQLPNSKILRPPPEGCSKRAMWVGSSRWTGGGEAFALKLDSKILSGKQYDFSFTYCKDGQNAGFDSAPFSPIVYTSKARPTKLLEAVMVGRLPGVFDWQTNTISFTAAPQQDGHEWIILHGLEISGTFLSNCLLAPMITNFDGLDTALCTGSSWELKAEALANVSYQWQSGEQTTSITATTAGTYRLTAKFGTCENIFSTTIGERDCALRLTFPNYFSPNGDNFNEVFRPIEHNFVSHGEIRIMDRWGKKIFKGDLFEGWPGTHTSPGVYYYITNFSDENGASHEQKGIVTLAL